MHVRGQHTAVEIQSQPDVWAQTLHELESQAAALRTFLREGAYEQVFFTGCGSTYYLAVTAAALLHERSGVTARALPASELWLGESITPGRRMLLVAVSRSGTTTETLRACQRFRAEHIGDILTISCHPGTELSSYGALNLVLPAAQEQSIAQTRAFSTLYLATVVLALLWTEEADVFARFAPLPAAGREILSRSQQFVVPVAQDDALDRFYVLGSGARYGLACEVSLKLKEMSLSHSEPFHVLEFRHGPQAMVTASTLIIGMVSQRNRDHERTVLNEMRLLGARVLEIGYDGSDIVLNSGLDPSVATILYLLPGQMLAFERALHRGCDPDRPHNLRAVVTLSETAATGL